MNGRSPNLHLREFLAAIHKWEIRNYDSRRAGSLLLLFAGIVLLAYVATQYGETYLGQRRLARQWQQQSAARQEPGPVKKISEADALTRLSIPKMDLDAVVVEGTSRKDLLLGPGHVKETVEPGEIGNAAISAHRDTFFRHLHELEKGDEINVQRAGKEYRYQVTGKRIVEPEDVFVLKPTTDAQLTLITCYPTYYIGPSPHRLIVFSKLMEDSSSATASSSPSPQPSNKSNNQTSAR